MIAFRLLIGFLATLSTLKAEETRPAAPAPAPPDGTAALEALERKVLYYPRKYDRGAIAKFTSVGGRRLDYKTSAGAQSAWYLAPSKPVPADGRLWIICGGNGTLALEMAGFCRREAFPADGWLLVDYPGYGECEGQPSPAGIRENMKTCVPLAAAAMNLKTASLPQRACVLGHSLGCAAALLAVEEFKVQRALLLAPFTSTRDMASERFALPSTVPLQHLFDNRTGLALLAKQNGRCCIFHGTADEVIPAGMSERLAREFPATVQLTLVPDGRHNDLTRRAGAEISKAMAALRAAGP